jgi:hypothetical protein
MNFLLNSNWKKVFYSPHAKMEGHSRLYIEILFTTSAVATRGLNDTILNISRIENFYVGVIPLILLWLEVLCFLFRNIWCEMWILIFFSLVAKKKFVPHLPKILLTHPFETCKIREISQGLAPECANSTIFCLVESGSGRPPTKTPPSWLTPEWPFYFYLFIFCIFFKSFVFFE